MRALHDDARAVLRRWEPPGPEQARLRADFLHYVETHDDAVLRTSRPAHVTASTLVLDPAARAVLLTLHWKVGRWLQLGGHCEPGDASLLAAAAREAQEESGLADLVLHPEPIRLDRHVVRCRADGSEGTHLDVQFAATGSSVPPLAPTFESLELRWWPVDALPADTDDSVRALVRAALWLG